MNLEEYQQLTSPFPEFKVSDLKNQANRTLLWGYDCDRNSWHTYLEDGVIHHVVYGYPDKLQWSVNSSEGLFSINRLTPDKRIYPEACDYEFLTILQSRECYLPFTSFQQDRPVAQYYGKLLKDLTSNSL